MNNKVLWSVVGLIVIIGIILFATEPKDDTISLQSPNNNSDADTVSTLPPGTAKLPAGNAPVTSEDDVKDTWVWSRTVVRDAPVITPKKTDAFVVTFESGGRVYGTTDCNSFGGEYTVASDGVIRVDNIVSTEKACGNSQEMIFTGQLRAANRYSFDTDGNLLINYDNDAGSMIFRKK